MDAGFRWPDKVVSPAPNRLIWAGEQVDLSVVKLLRGCFAPLACAVSYDRLRLACAGAGHLLVADVPVLVASSADAWNLRRQHKERDNE
jgi:hypothetical protein